LLVMFGERSEFVRSGSGVDGGERHVWLRALSVSVWKCFNGGGSRINTLLLRENPAWAAASDM
jgi:hypothetical protein